MSAGSGWGGKRERQRDNPNGNSPSQGDFPASAAPEPHRHPRMIYTQLYSAWPRPRRDDVTTLASRPASCPVPHPPPRAAPASCCSCCRPRRDRGRRRRHERQRALPRPALVPRAGPPRVPPGPAPAAAAPLPGPCSCVPRALPPQLRAPGRCWRPSRVPSVPRGVPLPAPGAAAAARGGSGLPRGLFPPGTAVPTGLHPAAGRRLRHRRQAGHGRHCQHPAAARRVPPGRAPGARPARSRRAAAPAQGGLPGGGRGRLQPLVRGTPGSGDPRCPPAPPPGTCPGPGEPRGRGGTPAPQVTPGVTGERFGNWGARGGSFTNGVSSALPLPHLHEALIN